MLVCLGQGCQRQSRKHYLLLPGGEAKNSGPLSTPGLQWGYTGSTHQGRGLQRLFKAEGCTDGFSQAGLPMSRQTRLKTPGHGHICWWKPGNQETWAAHIQQAGLRCKASPQNPVGFSKPHKVTSCHGYSPSSFDYNIRLGTPRLVLPQVGQEPVSHPSTPYALLH